MFSPGTVLTRTLKVVRELQLGVPVQTLGTVLALGSPQPGGTTPSRRSMAVRKAAKDQVRSRADRGAPVFRSNCSSSEPSAGVYFFTTATKSSAYLRTASMREL